MHSRHDRIGAAVIFLVTFTVFALSPVRTVVDSRYAMLFSQQVLWNHSFSLEPQALPEVKPPKPGEIRQRGINLPYPLLQVGQRYYDFYPPGNVILSMPYVALANVIGISAIDQNGIHDQRGEKQLQTVLAALLMAGLSVIIFFTSRLLLSFRWSLLISAGTAFGTQVWSTASRAMWIHTWGIFILAFVIWLIVRAQTRKARLHPVLLGTCLSWLYFVRPTFSISIVAIALYVLVYHRQEFLALVLTGCAWLAAFVGYSQYHFGHLLPPYYQSDAFPMSASFGEGLAGTLISPSRGLLIYVPVIVFVVYLLIRYGETSRTRWVMLAGGVAFLHLILLSLFGPWHGGYCYGPRLSTDLVPWFALMAMLAVEARLRWHDRNRARDSVFRMRGEWIFGALLLVCSVTLNGLGATWQGPWRWNTRPTSIDYDHARLWDWKHPQILGMPRDPVASDKTGP